MKITLVVSNCSQLRFAIANDAATAGSPLTHCFMRGPNHPLSWTQYVAGTVNRERRIGGDDPNGAPAMTGRVEAIPPRLLDWLLFEVGNTSDLAGFLSAFGGALEGNGLAVWRVTFHIPTFHPEQRGFTFEGASGGTTEGTPRGHGIELTSAYLPSPWR